MRGNDFLEKMGLIDPAYVEAADTATKKKKIFWMQWGAIAACFAVIVVAATMLFQNCPLTCRCCRFLKTLRVEWDMRDIWLMTFRNS